MDAKEFREAGHQMVDKLADYFESVGEKPLFPDVKPSVLKEMYSEPLPREGKPAAEVLAELDEKFFPYCTHVNHPGYFGLITPTPTPMGVIGDFIASAMNQNLGSYLIGPSAVTMERQTVRWLCDLIGYGSGAGGNLTSGGTMANFIGLKLGRDWASDDRDQHAGVTDHTAVYASEERHVAVDKAVDCIGVGRKNLRILPTNEKFQVDLKALEKAIEADRARGIRPICILAVAGATNSGAVDDLKAIRRIADREKMWVHADAAYGGGLLLSKKHRSVLKGLEQCDSVTIDPHKWFYAPVDAGAVLVKDERRLTASFGLQPHYLVDDLDPDQDRYLYYVHGFEQSRRFRAMKVWMSFKRYGADQIAKWVEANIDQALHLHKLVEESEDFESAFHPVMSAMAVRYTAGEMGEEARAELHHTVARKIEEGGQFWISTNFLKGRTWFRINPVNFRTTKAHLEALLDALRTESKKVST